MAIESSIKLAEAGLIEVSVDTQLRWISNKSRRRIAEAGCRRGRYRLPRKIAPQTESK